MMHRVKPILIFGQLREVGKLIDDLIDWLKLSDTLLKLVLGHRIDFKPEVVLASDDQVCRVPPEALDDQGLANSPLSNDCRQINESMLYRCLHLFHLFLPFHFLLPPLIFLTQSLLFALMFSVLKSCFFRSGFRMFLFLRILSFLVAATTLLL